MARSAHGFFWGWRWAPWHDGVGVLAGAAAGSEWPVLRARGRHVRLHHRAPRLPAGLTDAALVEERRADEAAQHPGRGACHRGPVENSARDSAQRPVMGLSCARKGVGLPPGRDAAIECAVAGLSGRSWGRLGAVFRYDGDRVADEFDVARAVSGLPVSPCVSAGVVMPQACPRIGPVARIILPSRHRRAPGRPSTCKPAGRPSADQAVSPDACPWPAAGLRAACHRPPCIRTPLAPRPRIQPSAR